MLPAPRRMRHRLEISTVVRSGDRAGCRLLVVHGVAAQRPGCARFAFAVGRNVGNSVQRHKVTRRFRHLVMADVDDWDQLEMDFVVRALPPAATASSDELRVGLAKCRRRLARNLDDTLRGHAAGSSP
ncbi:MAG: ribonuclease P protein component [Nocardioides sp.]